MAAETIKQISQGGVVRDIEDATARTLIQSLQNALDFLTNGDTTSAIESFNEIISFLENVEDTDTLAGIIAGIQTSIASKVTAVNGKGLSTNDFTDALLAKLNGLSNYNDTALQTAVSNLQTALQNVYTKSQTYNKDEVDNRISQMQAQIEEESLTVITGEKLSLWLDEDGESINIMAGDVPDIAATPTISHVVNNDGTATVTITNNEQGATVYHTTDGSTPTISSSVYSSAITLNTAGMHTIKAIAVIADKLISSIATDSVTISACTTPVISVDDTARTQAVVTATAGSDESVTLIVNKGTPNEQSDSGTGSASVTINKGTSSQTLPAEATASYTGKLTATATQSVNVSAKGEYEFGEYDFGGKAADASVPITVSTSSSYQNMPVTFDTVDGVVYWKIDLQGKIPVIAGYKALPKISGNSSIFASGSNNVLTVDHIPSEVTMINCAFGGCSSLKSVSAPGVTNVTNGAFKDCSSLESVSLGTVASVGDNSFYGCSSLSFANIDLSASTTIGSSSFRECTLLTSANLASATVINADAFRSSGLTSLTLAEGLTEIKGTAFLYCSLTAVTIPSTVTTIGGMAFQSGTHKTITVLATTPPSISTNSFGDVSTIDHIYVQASYVETYKAASGWSTYSTKIEATPSN